MRFEKPRIETRPFRLPTCRRANHLLFASIDHVCGHSINEWRSVIDVLSTYVKANMIGEANEIGGNRVRQGE